MAGKPNLRVSLLLPALLRICALGVVAVLLGVFFDTTVGLVFAVLALAVLLAFHLVYLSLLADWLERQRAPRGHRAGRRRPADRMVQSGG